MIKGIFWILLFLCLGEGISYAIGGFIPGSVIGMMLIFLALYFKLVKFSDVESVAHFLTKNMALFFVPASVGVMTSWGVIKSNWLSLVIISVVTTLLVQAVVALVQEGLEKRK